VREPTLLPVFGKLGAKPPVAVAATATGSTSMDKAAARVRAVLSSHGPLALKLSLVLWTVAVLAAAFFITRA
jgi:hypothetical protein